MKNNLIIISFIIVTGLFGLWQKACAIADDYIDETLVYSTSDKGELELEYWVGYGRDRVSNEHFYGNTFEVEYGITKHWMIEGQVMIEHLGEDRTVFEEGEFETRYRFLEEGDLPVDIALAGGLNSERNDDGKQEPSFEPRLIVSKDIDKINVTLNLPVDIPLRDEGQGEFTPALGTSYQITSMFRVGSEVKYDVETHEGSVIPQLFIYLPHDITTRLGFSHGFSDNHEDFGRLAIEFEL
jgi:hypothetical protein